MKKRIFSVALAGVMGLSSVVPALAVTPADGLLDATGEYANSTGSVVADKDAVDIDGIVGKDTTQGKYSQYDVVVDGYTGTTMDETESEVEVYATVAPSYGVKIPKVIILSASGLGLYDIGVKGDMSGAQTLTIAPVDKIADTAETDFYMSEQNAFIGAKDDVVAVVEQSKTEWVWSDINKDDYTWLEEAGKITADDISAGSWAGSFDFSFSVDAVKAGLSNDNTISLSSDLPVGIYTLKYENNQGIMTEFADICSLEITDEEKGAEYKGLIKENCAPVGATNIGVYNSNGEKVEEIPLNNLDSSYLGEKLYSFAAISDTHVGANTGESDFRNALTYFESDSDIKFTAICGDLTLSGLNQNLTSYKSIIDNYSTKPVYGISGNHEANIGYLGMETLKPYTGQDLYYSFTYNNDVYIMVGMYDVHEGQEFADGELLWLYETLEANKDKRCFVFMHLFPGDGSGDAINLDIEGDMLDNTQGDVFYSLMSHYKNAIWFHGHSHQEFAIQEVNKMNNYDNIYATHSIHIPSLAYPKYISGSSLASNYNASEGYIVDVYENYIVLKGRDFISGKFLPIASYSLDTTIKNVEADSYYDSTGTIINSNSNILKNSGTWYEGSVNKNTITKISLENSFSGNYDESWDASVSNNNQVTAYRTGTEITLVGNSYGIVANSNSNEMFSGFSSLTEIKGLENLNTSAITSLEGMFKNCKNLKSLNLSSFSDAKPSTMMNVFNGCSSIENIDISNFNVSNANKYQNLFYGCSSLTNVKLPKNIAVNLPSSSLYLNSMFSNCSSLKEIDMRIFAGRNISIGGTFNGCSSLINVKFGENKIIGSGLNATFKDCSKLETLDISGFDVSNCDNMGQTFDGCKSLKTLVLPNVFNTSKVTTMIKMFNNCSSLTLDCSGWDTSSCTNITQFNENASGIIAPVIN